MFFVLLRDSLSCFLLSPVLLCHHVCYIWYMYDFPRRGFCTSSPHRQVTDSKKQALQSVTESGACSVSAVWMRPTTAVEVYGCLQSGEFVPADKPVKIQGYTAERLIEELGLHPIGAYKTLADFCDDSSGTLELIEKGIIKKQGLRIFGKSPDKKCPDFLWLILSAYTGLFHFHLLPSQYFHRCSCSFHTFFHPY